MENNKKSTNSNFGKWGWLMILYAALSFYFSSALGADLLNFYPAQFEALRGWNAGLITTSFGRYDFVQANKVIAPLNTIVRCGGIILAGIFSQTALGYSGLYALLIVTSLIGMLLIKLLVKDECGTK